MLLLPPLSNLTQLSQEIIWQKLRVKLKLSVLYQITVVVNLSVDVQVAFLHHVEVLIHLVEVHIHHVVALLHPVEVLLEAAELKDVEAHLEHH